jgi:hypothetical protein
VQCPLLEHWQDWLLEEQVQVLQEQSDMLIDEVILDVVVVKCLNSLIEDLI